ncbi:MAG: homocysteine S-methyltransferase family protein [Deltaproteobacteria bacterium]|nr:homocysteine S-methyltransferase family protein [Deltaproteobacteria bacterium]
MRKGKSRIERLLRRRIVVLDGATGTEVQKRGMPSGVCPELWCLDNIQLIEEIHSDYQRAGADVVYSATFGANRIKLSQYGISDVRGTNRELARAARRAVGEGGLVAGDMGPTGRFVEPFGDLAFEEAVEIFREQAEGLAEGGVDLFVIETMMDIQEARAALIAVKEVADIFTMVTMTYENDGRTLNGTDPVTALITLQSLGADAVGCNCSTGPEEMIQLIEAMKPYSTVPLVAKPNAGIPELVGNTAVFTMKPLEFAFFGREFASKGVNMIGGCCGTAPEHIEKLREAIVKETPRPPERRSLSAVSSARTNLLFERDKPLLIIGERINPTGKKALQGELREGKMTLVKEMAHEQEKRGADLLDVNVGVPGIDEKKVMAETISALAETTNLPLVIDSASAETMEEALRLYPGRALLNSISGEKNKINKLLPLAAKYGAMFILLPLTDRGVPDTAAERADVIREVFEEAQKNGYTKDDFIADGLVMTVSSNPEAPRETLKTVEWCSRHFKCKTVLGLSNVSFGMPERKWLNAAFIAMAAERGLTAAIANPEAEELMNFKYASDVLNGRDKDSAFYLGRFAASTHKVKKSEDEAVDSHAEFLFRAVLGGNREGIERIIGEALKSGESASMLIDDIMIPAITEVGNLFDRREYFLPQLIASAEAMKRGIACLKPHLKDKKETAKKGLVLMATVKGDIHDIGKNIVSLMLSNQGFEVVDLGKDVSAEVIIEAARSLGPDIIGLSALMTTTMVNMKEIVEGVERENLRCKFMIGGAVVSESFANSIGAHYARDGVDAVRVANKLL